MRVVVMMMSVLAMTMITSLKAPVILAVVLKEVSIHIMI